MGKHGLHAVHPRAWEHHHVLPTKGCRSHHRMSVLTNALGKQPDPTQKLRILVMEIKRSPSLFSGLQVLSLAPFFNTNLIIALHLMDHHLLGVTANVASQILNFLPAPEQKLEALKVLSEHILDPVNRNELMQAFVSANNPVLWKQAQAIVDAIRGSSHVYGRIKSNNVIFLIDTSGSMATQFTTECGKNFNRLEFVVHDLHKIIHHRVPKDFRFNIYTFSHSVQKWHPSMTNATSSHLKDAEHFLDHLEAMGGTNTNEALTEAMSDPEAEAIYLLSDGEPTGGCTEMETIVQNVLQMKRNRATPIEVHAIAFLMGDDLNDPKPRQLMANIAQAGGGVFRCLDPTTPDDEEHGNFLSEPDFDSQSFRDFFDSRMAAVPQSALQVCQLAQANVPVNRYPNLPPPPDWKGALAARQRMALEIAVPKVEEHATAGHHIYDVQVVLQNAVPNKTIAWTLPKTYNEFKALHDLLHKANMAAPYPFPPDPHFHKHDSAFLEGRRRELEQYIQSMYVTFGPFANTPLSEFLMYETYVNEAIAEATDIYQAAQLASQAAPAVPVGAPQ